MGKYNDKDFNVSQSGYNNFENRVLNAITAESIPIGKYIFCWNGKENHHKSYISWFFVWTITNTLYGKV